MFEDVFGPSAGVFLRRDLLARCISDFTLRMEFIDFCRSYRGQMFKVRFKEEGGVELNQRSIDIYIDFLKEKINQASFFRSK